MTLNLSRKCFLFFAGLSLFLFLTTNSVSFAQAIFGNIIGSVTDPSGSAVPNASVDVTDADRGSTYHVVTNDSGNFEVTHLLAGHYKVRVTAPGFGNFESGAEVQIDASTRVDAALGLQQTSTKVEVSSDTPLMKVDRADVSTTLTRTNSAAFPSSIAT